MQPLPHVQKISPRNTRRTRKFSTMIGHGRNGHKTSVSLEPAFRNLLSYIAQTRKMPLQVLISEIEDNRYTPDNPTPCNNLSSECRLRVIEYLAALAGLTHILAGDFNAPEIAPASVASVETDGARPQPECESHRVPGP